MRSTDGLHGAEKSDRLLRHVLDKKKHIIHILHKDYVQVANLSLISDAPYINHSRDEVNLFL